ncbi:MAG: hypothetical protein KIS87_00505 [Phycisphaeraceae bacterium]|nr:hypothetical protein [Phycisphaeraceae bacterium]
MTTQRTNRTVRSNRLVRAAAMLVAAAGIAFSAAAGPEDQGTKYPVGVTIGDTEVSGIVDSGGTTTLSYEDAKKLGLLDENGDPKKPADGSVSLGGTGGGSVKCHVFNKVKIKVQPKNADGTNNGPAREIEVKVFVPKKPSEQEGDNDAAKARKTNSVVTKVGANVAGATIDGHKLVLNDKETADPKKNERSTGWVQLNHQPQQQAPVQLDDNYEDEIIEETSFALPAHLNGQPVMARMIASPVSCISQQLAMALGIVPVGQAELDFANHSALFTGGLTDMVPDAHQSVVCNYGHAFVEIMTVFGPPIHNQPVAFFILPPSFLPDQNAVVLGGNAYIPENHSGWLDNDTGLFNLMPLIVPCPADFNGDTVVNTLDVLAFLNAYTSGDPRADFNGDTVVNTLDVLAFLNAYNAGCN